MIIATSPHLQAALDNINEDAYVRRSDGTLVPQSSSRAIIATMLERLDVASGMRVLEIGTGSGYSTALLVHLAGKDGNVVSVDVDPGLTARAKQLLKRDEHKNATLITADGVNGVPTDDLFDRVIAWATVEQIPSAWVVQAAPGAVIVAPVQLTSIAKTHAIVRAHLNTAGFPVADEMFPGGFVEIHDQILDQWLVPPRGCDALAHDDEGNPWWISAQWLRHTADKRAGPALLDLLLADATEKPGPLAEDENADDFYAYLLAIRPDGLTTAALGEPLWRIGYTSSMGAALTAKNQGQRTVHAGDLAALEVLTGWAVQWRELGKPGYRQLRPELDQDEHGWRIRATLFH